MRFPMNPYHCTRLLAGCLVLLVILGSVMQAEAATVKGVVLIEDTGKPAPGIKVYLYGRPPYETTTDEHGRFEIRDVIRGIYTVVAKPRGYYPGRYRVNLGDEDTISVELKIRPRENHRSSSTGRPELEVIVIGGPRAQAVEGAKVTIKGPTTRTQYTNRVGRTVFSGIEPGGYRIIALHPGHGRTEEEIKMPPGGVKLREILRFFPTETSGEDTVKKRE